MCYNYKKGDEFMQSLVYRIIGFIISASGIIMHFMSDNMAGAEFMVRHKLAYFTIQTNVIISAMFLYLIVKALINHRKSGKFETVHINKSTQMAFTLYITITMLGYWFMLMPSTGIPKNPVLFINTLTLHTITPILAIIDLFLFADDSEVKKGEIFKWMIYPLCYYIFVKIYSKTITEPYYSFKMNGKTIDLMIPYPFLDETLIGVKGVVISIIFLLIIFSLLGLLYIYMDKRKTKSSNKF